MTTIDAEALRRAAEILDTLTSNNLADGNPLRLEASQGAKAAVADLYRIADDVDAQAAEIARLRNSAWTNGDILKDAQAKAAKLHGDIIGMREALRWTTAALNECCVKSIRVDSIIFIDSTTRTFAEILNAADTALQHSS